MLLHHVCLHYALLSVLLHQLHSQSVLAEVGHALPQQWLQEHLAHHITLQCAGVAQEVAQELLPDQVQLFTEHVDVQVIPVSGER